MATSRREPPPNGRVDRTIRNMSQVLKPTEPGQGLRRAKSVPSSPDRKFSPSPASSSSNACRPSSSFTTRTASSKSTSSTASSSMHGKTLHPAYSLTATKPAKGKADKSGGTSLWPPALAAPSPSSKDATRVAKSPSTLQKSKLSLRPSVDKMAVSSPKLRTDKAMPGALAAGKTQVMSSARTPGTAAKRRTGAANAAPSIQRTRSVPARPTEAPRIKEEQELELLMEFDEMESIGTPSIEEHLQERLPDPVELKPVDAIAYDTTSQDDLNKPFYNQQEDKNEEVKELISEEKHEAEDNEDLNGGENAHVGINSEVDAVKEAADGSDLKESVDETELIEKAADGTELRKPLDEPELPQKAANETELKESVDEPKLIEKAVDETELKESVDETELIEKEGAKVKVEKVMTPTKSPELVQGWRKDDARSNEVIEEARSKLLEKRKSKVKALVGAFETVMSGRE